jgi:hypothetical protein
MVTREAAPETRVVLTVTVTVVVLTAAGGQTGSGSGEEQGPPLTKNLGVWA